MLVQDSNIEKALRQWLENVVIGLNLCPFASRPHQDNLVRFITSDAQNPPGLIKDITTELQRLDQHPSNTLETTLIAMPNCLADFYDYNDFLTELDTLLMKHGWQGVYQVASFHPNYQFAGTQPKDKENLTNRSPYPLVHLIREASIEKALKHHPDPQGIPQSNIELVEGLSAQQMKTLFGYLK